MKILIPAFLFILCSETIAQKQITECHPAPTEKFAMFTAQQSFKEAHLTPVNYRHVSESGKSISFKTPDGKNAYGYLIKAKKPTKKFLFVFHEWYGLNDYVKRESEKLFKDIENVNVLAIDLYDQKTAANSDEASKLVQQVEKSRAESIIKGAQNYAGSEAEIATLGWCFGGGWSLQAALLLEGNIQACVIYYGMPELDIKKLEKLDCEVLGVFAAQDQWINPDIVGEFAQKMEQVGNDLTYKIFDAVHGFANPSNPKYDSEATAEAYNMTVKFLKKEL